VEVFAGNSCSVPVNVIVAGEHVDTDSNLVTAVLASHPSAVPTVTRLGLGRYLLTFSGLSPSLAAGTVTQCVVTVTIDSVTYTPFGIPISVVASTPVVVAATPPTVADGSVGSFTVARQAITGLIASISAIPDGDPTMPEVLEFQVGRKEVRLTGPLRKAQALALLSAELRALERDLNAATQAASRGSSFVRLGMPRC